jgi:hypothetical protein
MNETPEARGIMQVGRGHIDERDEGRDETQKNLMERLHDNKDFKSVRVDIVPIDEAFINKRPHQLFHNNEKSCLVCIGGLEGADYTIFVPGNIAIYHLTFEGAKTPKEHEAIAKDLEATKPQLFTPIKKPVDKTTSQLQAIPKLDEALALNSLPEDTRDHLVALAKQAVRGEIYTTAAGRGNGLENKYQQIIRDISRDA